LIIGILDLETTGKLTADGKIIEVSLRVCDYDTGTEERAVLFRCNPGRNIEAAAVKVHHITNDDVKSEKSFREHLPTLLTELEEIDYLVAHNLIGFDLPYLKQEIEACGGTFPEVKTFDTMIEGTFCTDLGKSPSLSELCFALDVEYDPTRAHRGDYDTEVLRDCFFNAVRFGWFNLK
jgi:DNA polymerase-3 subunit epsilon